MRCSEPGEEHESEESYHGGEEVLDLGLGVRSWVRGVGRGRGRTVGVVVGVVWSVSLVHGFILRYSSSVVAGLASIPYVFVVVLPGLLNGSKKVVRHAMRNAKRMATCVAAVTEESALMRMRSGVLQTWSKSSRVEWVSEGGDRKSL